jgi:hypothetical protein
MRLLVICVLIGSFTLASPAGAQEYNGKKIISRTLTISYYACFFLMVFLLEISKLCDREAAFLQQTEQWCKSHAASFSEAAGHSQAKISRRPTLRPNLRPWRRASYLHIPIHARALLHHGTVSATQIIFFLY